MEKPRILFYDCETSPLQAWVWGTGEQYIRHQQLIRGYQMWGIICITYCWNDGEPAKSIDWGYEEQDTKRVVAEFDEIVKQADHLIGKNSDRFDVKMINACRMFSGLPGMPEWMLSRDDLEKQMRKYFRLPSQSLDYISEQLGFGGKIKMELQDWINICEKNEGGRQSFDRMIEYGKKDTEDTRAIWYRLSQHFDPKFNMSTFVADGLPRCKWAECGSTEIRKNGTRISGGVKYQTYLCTQCCRYAGKTSINSKTGKEGKIT